MLWICLSMMVLSFAISLPSCSLLIRMARHRGDLDEPGSQRHKQHLRAVPNVGGAGVFWSLFLPMSAALGVAWWGGPQWLASYLLPLETHLPGLRSRTPAILAVMGGMLIMHVLGWVDDRRNLGPGLKLSVQLGVAGVLVIFFDIRVLHLLDQWGWVGTVASILLSVFWIGLITNAMNMLDNMDGLAGGVALIIACIYLAATVIGSQWFVAAICAMLIGGLLGFLVYNLPPARVFMGDRGSLVIGFLLALISMRTTYFSTSHDTTGPVSSAWYSLLMPLVVMAVPLYDFVTVLWVRQRLGRSPFQGDHNHFSHRLIRRGLSPRGAVGLIWLCTLATGLGGSMLGSVSDWQAWVIGGQVVCVLVILAILEFSSDPPIQ